MHRGSGTVAGRLWIAGVVGCAAGGVIGRHASADLVLSGDPSLSLRHLAVLVEPLRGWGADDVRFRILDLRTGTAFFDEQGRSLQAVLANGPAFLTVGDYALLMFPTGEQVWPTDPATAYALLSRRAFLDSQYAEPDRWVRRESAASMANPPRRPTFVALVPGPMEFGEPLLASGEALAGTLTLVSKTGRQTLHVGLGAAERGVLLGRLPRCDGFGILTHPSLSRVHVMLVRIGRRTYAHDMSSAGTWAAGAHGTWERVRMLALERQETLVLGSGLASITWTAAAHG